jgi:MarR family transcriptional regulator, organic hydroperoxide resistance regulator
MGGAADRRVTRLDDLIQVERDMLARVGDLPLDLDALVLVSNLHRAVAAIRREFEKTVLAEVRLSWTAFTVMWVLWVWGETETRELAHEANVTKGTLTGVLDTLEKRGLVERRRRARDRRLVAVKLTDPGEILIADVFPRFNREEQRVADLLTDEQREAMDDGLRRILRELGP